MLRRRRYVSSCCLRMFGADAEVLRCSRTPPPTRAGCRRPISRSRPASATDVAERLRHLVAGLGEQEAVREHARRRARGRACAQDSKQRGMEPAAMLVGAFEVERGRPFSSGAAPARRRGSSRSRTRRRGCRRPWSIPPGSWSGRRNRAAAPSLYQASAPSFSNAATMRAFTRSSLRISAEPSPVSRTNTAIGTPQARWREITQSGLRLDHAGDAVLALRRHPARRLDRRRARASRSVSPVPVDVLVHGDEPLRGVAEDHRLLGAPGVRILVREPRARDAACRRRAAPRSPPRWRRPSRPCR